MHILIVTAEPIQRVQGRGFVHNIGSESVVVAGNTSINTMFIQDIEEHSLRGRRYNKVLVPKGINMGFTSMRTAYDEIRRTVEFIDSRIEFY